MGMPAAVAVSAWNRSLVELPEGGWITRPNAETAAAVLAGVAALDILEVYRGCLSPVLIVNAQRPPHGISPEAAAFHRAHRGGVAQVLGDLAHEHEHVHYAGVDATHGLIYEQPASLALMVTRFIQATTGAAALPTG
jgi:hypothetical protein